MAKVSLILGERAPGDQYSDMKPSIPIEETRASYGMLPNQVAQGVYREPAGKLTVSILLS